MLTRLEVVHFVLGFFIGIAIGFATLAILLLQIAPAFKGAKM